MTRRRAGCLAAAMAASGIAGAVLMAPGATAAPDCVQTGPNTTQCSTKGSSAITTSPPAINGPFYGYPYGFLYGGGLVLDIG